MALSVGDTAPEFVLESQFGERVSLTERLAVRPVALVFFPLAFTGVCTGELCELRDNLALFADAGVDLIAVSVDSKATLRQFAEREGYDFTLLADFWPHGETAERYEVLDAVKGTATRATFVVAQDGRVAASFASTTGEARPISAYREALSALR